MFCGLIYNDFMAIPLNLFGSCFDTKTGKEAHPGQECVYPIGVDPIWF
jgi:V-type H+-transporting ATPase subunit a